MQWTMRHRRELVLVLAVAMAFTMAFMVATPPADAWPAPEITGDCENWEVREKAPDRDWTNTEYWSIVGFPGNYERGVSVFIEDQSNTTQRSFTVEWYDSEDNLLDKRTGHGTRDLSECSPTLEFNFTATATCDGVVVDGWVNGPDDEYFLLADNGLVGGEFPVSTLPRTLEWGVWDFSLWDSTSFVDGLTNIDGAYEEPDDCETPDPDYDFSVSVGACEADGTRLVTATFETIEEVEYATVFIVEGTEIGTQYGLGNDSVSMSWYGTPPESFLVEMYTYWEFGEVYGSELIELETCEVTTTTTTVPETTTTTVPEETTTTTVPEETTTTEPETTTSSVPESKGDSETMAIAPWYDPTDWETSAQVVSLIALIAALGLVGLVLRARRIDKRDEVRYNLPL